MARIWTLTLAIALLAAGLGAAMPAASAQTSECFGPANDCFGSAVTVTSPSTSSVNTSTFNLQLGEPRPCGGIGATAWYSFTPAGSGTASVHTSGSSFDTVLAIYTGSSVTSLTNLGCNDDVPDLGLGSRVNFTCVAGTTYRMQLGGYSTPETTPKSGLAHLHLSGCEGSFGISPPTDLVATTGAGAGQIALKWTAADLPPGDEVNGYHIYRGTTSGGEIFLRTVGAINSSTDTGLASNTRYYYKLTAVSRYGESAFSNEASAVTRCTRANDCFALGSGIATSRPATWTATTTNQSLEPGEPLDCGASGATVWFKFTAVSDGYATITRTAASGSSPILNVYTGTSVGALAWHGCVGGSSLSLRCVKGSTYHLQVASPSGTGTYRLEGCGQTGATTSTAENAVVGAHEGTVSGPCWNLAQCRQNVGYDADAYVKVDTNPLTRNADGTLATGRVSVWERNAIGGERSASAGIVIVTPPPPPPPPGCGVGCDPGSIAAYAISVVNWAGQMEQWARSGPAQT